MPLLSKDVANVIASHRPTGHHNNKASVRYVQQDVLIKPIEDKTCSMMIYSKRVIDI